MENIKNFITKRQAIYAMLAALYRGDLDKVLKISEEVSVFKDFLIKKGYSRDIIEEIKQDREDLLEDYENLFVGPAAILAPPWESVYETEDRLLFGESELQVRKFYRNFGLDVSKKEPADHLAFQLAFMSRLFSIEEYDDSSKVKKNIKGQIDFLNNHLLTWTYKWYDEVAENAKTKFWRDISRIVVRWFKEDLMDLNNVIKSIK
ncbi:TorD/DmsD family molecular chaperone [Clostridium pasteurianum]|nr:molecular chaperone TorD family protein [Clostridium pasteurianum]